MRRARAAASMAAAMIILGACSSPAGNSASAGGSGGSGGQCVVGVSWNNFQQPRWGATDKPKMQKTIEDGGGKLHRCRREPRQPSGSCLTWTA